MEITIKVETYKKEDDVSREDNSTGHISFSINLEGNEIAIKSSDTYRTLYCDYRDLTSAMKILGEQIK